MPDKPFVRYLILAITILFGLATLIGSVMPATRFEMGTRPIGLSAGLFEQTAIIHLGIHVLMYSALSAAAWFTLALFSTEAVNKLITLIAIMLLGWGTEYLKHRLYDNPIETSDVLSDILASAATFGGLALWMHYRKPPPDEPLAGEHVAYILRDKD